LLRHFVCFCGKIDFLEKALAFNTAHPPKVARPITKSSRAVAKQCAQAEILKKGTTPAFEKEARMLRSEIDFPLVSQIGDRRCPQCRSSVRLAWIEPDEKPGYDRLARLSACIVTTWIL
jgi:hypothetical protein